LLDAYNPKEHGGTGETFDWEIAKRVQEIFPKMYLAGGLDSENIVLAISNLKPFAVDVCSGVEINKGKKDKIKLVNFITKANHQFNDLRFYEFLNGIQKRPQMFLGWKSFELFVSYLNGFEMALELSKSDFETGKFFSDFNQWCIQRLTGRAESKYGWSGIILKEADCNEEKAFDLFFALLEEFKLEKEDLSNE